MSKYQDWIERCYPTSDSAKCECEEGTKLMSTCFPELTVVRGQISVEEPYGLPPTKTTHWWCVTPDGKVVDPTGHQYPTKILLYEPVDDTKEEPTGKCMNCGDICYKGNNLCSEECKSEFMGGLK